MLQPCVPTLAHRDQPVLAAGGAGDELDLLTTRDRRVRLAGVRHHSTLRMPVADVAWRAGVPVTTPARTLVDLAGDLGPELGRAIDAALRSGVLTLADLVRCVGRFEGAHGRPLTGVRAAVAERLGREPGGSDGELWVLRTLLAAGLPVPVQEHPVVLEGRRRRIDLAYPEQMVAIEFEGEAVHDTVSAFHDDKARAGALAAAGWAVLPFTAETSEADIVRRARAALDLAALRRPA